MGEATQGEVTAVQEDTRYDELDAAIDGFAERIFGAAFTESKPEEQNFMRKIAAKKIAWLAQTALKHHATDDMKSFIGVIRKETLGQGHEVYVRSVVNGIYSVQNDPKLSPVFFGPRR